VHINCAALPAALIESELFGHEAGAFPGATRARFGKFEHARGGTVFLDEIDSLPLELQGKLLLAIESRAITRLGSNDVVPLDVRFVAASKRDLAQAATEGTFRADLLYRLNVVTLRMPALDARPEDVPRLFVHLVHEAAARYRRPSPDVPGSILQALATRRWPGNVRELRNVAERFVLDLDLDLGTGVDGPGGGTLTTRVAAFEKSLIAGTIAAHGGRLKDSYESLGISRKTLYEKMQKHGLSRQDFTDDDA